MGDKNLSICQLCKEPVWNFICPDCIAQGIASFLPSSLTSGYKKFHHSFISHFKSIDRGDNRCLHCKDSASFTVCPYCYTTEVYHWLEGVNVPLSKDFLSVFSFGFGDESVNQFLTGAESPLVQHESGICDECGEYTEELMSLDGEWVCKDCSIPS